MRMVLVPELGPQNSGYLVGSGGISADGGGTRVPQSEVDGAFPPALRITIPRPCGRGRNVITCWAADVFAEHGGVFGVGGCASDRAEGSQG